MGKRARRVHGPRTQSTFAFAYRMPGLETDNSRGVRKPLQSLPSLDVQLRTSTSMGIL